MTYMEQVAKMLDVEIGEEFKIEGHNDNLKFQFTENRFLQSYGDAYGWVDSISIMTVLEGRAKIIKIPKSILTEKEKEYLSYVIKPFRNRIKCFYKWTCDDCNYEQIMAPCTDYSHLDFPAFEKNTMYKGMEPNKKYTLEDLGL